jgi:hypothetical protein
MSMDNPKIERNAQKTVDQLASEHIKFFVVKGHLLCFTEGAIQVELIDWSDNDYSVIVTAIENAVVSHNLSYKSGLGKKILDLLDLW